MDLTTNPHRSKFFEGSESWISPGFVHFYWLNKMLHDSIWRGSWWRRLRAHLCFLFSSLPDRSSSAQGKAKKMIAFDNISTWVSTKIIFRSSFFDTTNDIVFMHFAEFSHLILFGPFFFSPKNACSTWPRMAYGQRPIRRTVSGICFRRMVKLKC